jgi:predicted  nucleic acid-binding Zn-ribbon protein
MQIPQQISSELKALRNDVFELKPLVKDVAELKPLIKDVAELKPLLKDVSDLRKDVGTLKFEVSNIKGDIKDLAEVVKQTQLDGRLFFNRIDQFVKRVDVIGNKDMAQDYRLRELEDVTAAHEKRITKLESDEETH